MSSDAVPADGCGPFPNGATAFHTMEDPDEYFHQAQHTRVQAQETPNLILKYIASNNKAKCKETRVLKVDWDLVQLFRSRINCNGENSNIVPQDPSIPIPLPKRYLEEIYKRVDGVCKESEAVGWPRCRNRLAEFLTRDFNGWQVYILKLHQLLAELASDEMMGCSTPKQASDSEKDSGTCVGNLTETLTLWSSVQKHFVEDIQADQSSYMCGISPESHYRYQDYVTPLDHADGSHNQRGSSEFSTKASTLGDPVIHCTAGTKHTVSVLTTNDESANIATFEERKNVQGYSDFYIALVPGVWAKLVSQIADDDNSKKIFENQYVKQDDGGPAIMMVDLDYLTMSVSATGRFDFYMSAIMAAMLNENGALNTTPKLLGGSWIMCRHRALHGLRVYVDATTNYRLTQAKYDWYVTLLTSGSLRAVQDTFNDLANDIWHAQFTRADQNSSKMLERVLVALLGHPNDLVRSQAAVFLNNLYDQHDWQQEIPFLPVVRCIGDSFRITVTLKHEANPAKGEKPEDTFLILSAPSFEVTSNFEVYSYHTLKWTPASRETVKNRLFVSSRAAPGGNESGANHTWIGEVDFGRFPRCGFFDWRVVKQDVESGSWNVVQCTIGELRERYESSYSFINLPSDSHDDASASASTLADSFSFRSRNLWPELGRLSDAQERFLALDKNPSPFRTLPLQGRFIVHPSEMRTHQVHEIFVDLWDARFSKDGSLVERGTFSKVGSAMADLAADGISAVELSGCLSRDNGDVSYTASGVQVYERPDASPFAVTCRATPCQSLGGSRAFGDLMKDAARNNIKVIVDSTSRVSSSRCHRKYWPHILHSIDEQGKRMMLYGSDGLSMRFEESCQLNYRKVETWDLLVNDISAWCTRMKVDGVRLDNAHTMPQLLEMDDEELNRLDADGSPHYTAEEKLRGETVLQCSDNCGYWASTAAASHWPNPLIVRLCRSLWRLRPHFIVIGDCSIHTEGFEKRPGVLARSGLIPQLQSLPEVLCRIFGKKIEPNGTVTTCATPASTQILSQWFESTHELLPEGAIVIQSSCSHSSPLPGLLYERGAWPAADFLFFSSDIPATCMGEDQGRAFRLGVSNIFKSTLNSDSSNQAQAPRPNSSSAQNSTGGFPVPQYQSDSLRKQQALLFGGSRKSGEVRKLATATSVLNLGHLSGKPFPSSIQGGLGGSGGTGGTSGGGVENPQIENLLTRARTLTEFQPLTAVSTLEEQHRIRLGPSVGFDLKKIPAHYRHRRMVRRTFEIFSKGILFPLKARNVESNTDIPGVFAFCRFIPETSDLVLAAINCTGEKISRAGVNLRFLSRHFYSQGLSASRVVELWDIFRFTDNNFEDDSKSGTLKAISEGDLECFANGSLRLMSLAEALTDVHEISLNPYGTNLFGLKLLSNETQDTAEAVIGLFVSSLTRLEQMVAEITANAASVTNRAMRRNLHANYIVASLLNAINIPGDVSALAEVLRNIERAAAWRREVWRNSQTTLAPTLSELGERIENFSLFKLLVDPNLLQEDPTANSVETSDRLFAKVETILQSVNEAELNAADIADSRQDNQQGITSTSSSPLTAIKEVYRACKALKEMNTLGPIVFMTVELGKWSVVGGLGVMVDELSQTLVNDLGQEVCVVSPYYHWNRKGETGYLEKDGIEWKFNIEIALGPPGSPPSIVLGVHEGYVRGVRLIFLHNESFFPYPYPDNQAAEAVKLLTVIGKSFLEALCQLKLIPQLIVTNDWTTGLIPAYCRSSNGPFFGTTFDQTTCFHILHNFDPAYEGRIYPPSRTEDFASIHGLKRDRLIDPLWSEIIINPSRCAILCSDNWGTVSRSYRDDLRGAGHSNQASPLAYLLNKFPKPFATPNGIPLDLRLARLKSLPVRTREEAKGYVQKKYFGFEQPDLSIPLFAFIGRITAQKGVHLILEAAESVLMRYNYRVQILVGGKVNWKDPYAARCGNHMYSLKERSPWAFWAEPNEFFNDGTLVNLAADFALMPSLFEPGGIVQHEFFIAGTPVIAYKTGGLKDTVFEYDLETQKGNGFTFAAYNIGDFVFAIERAHRVYQDADKYARLRDNARKSVVSCEACAYAWLGEFCRMRKKILVNSKKIKEEQATYPRWIAPSHNAQEESVISMVERMMAERKSRSQNENKASKSERSNPPTGENVPAETDTRRVVRIKFVPKSAGRRPRSVAVSGSFDDWRVRRPLVWDNSQQAFCATLALPPGKHIYKFIVDGDWVCYESAPMEMDSAGIINNILIA